jgi:hypothetical protein
MIGKAARESREWSWPLSFNAKIKNTWFCTSTPLTFSLHDAYLIKHMDICSLPYALHETLTVTKCANDFFIVKLFPQCNTAANRVLALCVLPLQGTFSYKRRR